MQLSTIRTKYFPILFLVAGLLFAALFALFYQLVFDATYDILDRQNRRLLTALAAAAEQRHGDFLRETAKCAPTAAAIVLPWLQIW